MVGCTQRTNSDFLGLWSPEFSSLVVGSDIGMRLIDSSQRNFAECLAEDTLGARLNEDVDTVTEEVSFIVERRGFETSRDEEVSFRSVSKVKRKSNDSVGPTSVRSGPWKGMESQSDKFGEICEQFQKIVNQCERSSKKVKLFSVNNP